MPRFRRVHRGPEQLPVDLHRQVQPGTFGFALHHRVHTTLTVEQLQRQNSAMIAMAYALRVAGPVRQPAWFGRSGMVHPEKFCSSGLILFG